MGKRNPFHFISCYVLHCLRLNRPICLYWFELIEIEIHVHIYIYVCVCVYIYMYTYMYVHRYHIQFRFQWIKQWMKQFSNTQRSTTTACYDEQRWTSVSIKLSPNSVLQMSDVLPQAKCSFCLGAVFCVHSVVCWRRLRIRGIWYLSGLEG